MGAVRQPKDIMRSPIKKSAPKRMWQKPTVDWRGRPPRIAKCPACGQRGLQRFVLSAGSCLDPSQRLALYKCRACSSMRWPDFAAPPYDQTTYSDSHPLKFYIEQGAAPDLLIAPCYYVPLERNARYLDIGCGLGFGPDYARRELGIDAIGMDPSALGREGRRSLGSHIRNQLLTRTTVVDQPGFDLIVASEVIEHVEDPRQFLSLLSSALSADGVLVLTTPNAGAVNTGASESVLMPVLSPGWHFMIFSAQGLRRLLQSCHFSRIEVVEKGETLVAYATRGERSVCLSAPIPRNRYLRYLQELSSIARPGSWLEHGALYRQFKELTNLGMHAEALAAFEHLADSYLHSYQIDIRRPHSVGIVQEPSVKFAAFSRIAPFNLCGVAYFRGILALNHQDSPSLAAAYFAFARRYGLALRRSLASMGADDRETEELTRVSEELFLHSLSYSDPQGAAQGSLELAHRAEPLTRYSEEHIQRSQSKLFVHLVNLGAHSAAELLEKVVAGHLRSGKLDGTADGLRLVSEVQRALGLLALNHRQDARAAVLLLTQAQRTALRWVQTSDFYLQRLRQERAFASKVAGLTPSEDRAGAAAGNQPAE
jgi:2-polyprenyl-3-methyl-5-hydroxy-6-metoxy-1,4-benzoquinol methylase